MIGEGTGECDRVNYAYKLLSPTPWFGCYECRVHRYFLDCPSKKLVTEFQIGGHTWQLQLSHSDSGTLAVDLWSRARSSVSVHFSITAINQTDATKNRCTGAFVPEFVPGLSFGDPKLVSISELGDERSGFLYGDSFVLKLEMRLKQPENESFVVSGDQTSTNCAWRLKGLHKASPWKLQSEEFSLGELKWGIDIFPHGTRCEKQMLDLYLFSHNHSAVRANCRICIINQSPDKNIIKDFEHEFKGFGNGYGFADFLDAKAFEDESMGFLYDGWITLTTYVSIEEQNTVQVPSAPPALPTIGLNETEKEPECVICLTAPQTSGVLHGSTTHKCFCLECARSMMERKEDFYCPICRAKVERIIEKMF